MSWKSLFQQVEIFIENRYINSLELQSKKIENTISGRDFGIGIRIFSGLQSIYTYTNDFSVEATGFYIKDGKIASPVKQMTIAGNFYTLMKDIEETCSELYFLPHGYGSSSLLVKELAVTIE